MGGDATGITTFNKTSLNISPSFGLHGAGFSKILDNGEFPYRITQGLSELSCFVGVFSELYLYEQVPATLAETHI